MGIERYEDLRRQGMSQTAIRQACLRGELVRVVRGIYLSGDLLPSARHLERMRATELHAGSAFSHHSAALVLGIPVLRIPDEPEIVTTSSHGYFRDGRKVRARSAMILDVDGFPCTDPATTVIDIARADGFIPGVVAADSFLRHANTPELAPGELLAAVEAARGMRGIAQARRAVAFADPASESPPESHSRALMEVFGMPRPELQLSLYGIDGLFLGRPDFVWPDLGVVGEYDGESKYFELRADHDNARDVLIREKWRQRDLENAGWVVARWGKADLADPRRLQSILREAFSHARRRKAA